MKNNQFDRDWITQFYCDLSFAIHLSQIFQYYSSNVIRDSKQISVQFENFFETQGNLPHFSKSLNEVDLEKAFKHSLEKYKEFKHLTINIEAREIVINTVYEKRKQLSRYDLLHTADRFWKDRESETRLYAELFRFIRGDLKFTSNIVNIFRICSENSQDLFLEGIKLSESDLKQRYKHSIEQCQSNQNWTNWEVEAGIETFIEACLLQRTLRVVHDKNSLNGYPLLRWRGKTDFWFILSLVFNLQTEVEGLSLLFGGGFPICNPPGNNIIISGHIGTGKTIFASSLAFEVASKQGLAIYISLEQDVSLLENIYGSFGWNVHPDVNFLKITNFEGETELNKMVSFVEKVVENKNGAIILCNNTPGGLSDLHDFIDIVVCQFGRKEELDIKTITIDPINSVRGLKEMEKGQLRQNAERMFERVKQSGFCGIFLTEEIPTIGQYSFEHSLADTVIQLSVSNEEYKKRLIEVTKSRVVPCIRGKSRFKLSKGKGIEIFPSGAAIASIKRGRQFETSRIWLESGIKGLDELLGGGAQTGTITSLIGNAGCGKSTIAINWLINGARKNQPGLYFSFVRQSDEFENLVTDVGIEEFTNISSIKDRNKAVTPLLKVVNLPVEGLTSGKIFYEIETWTRLNKRKGVSPFRIVIDDLSYLEIAVAGFSSIDQFLPALIEIVRTDKIGVMLCFSNERKQEKLTHLENEILIASTNVLEFLQVGIEGQQHFAVYTKKCKNPDYDRETREVVLKNNQISIEPSFSLFSDVRKGTPTPIEIDIYLHDAYETQKKYNNFLIKRLRESTTNKISLHNQPVYSLELSNLTTNPYIEKNIRIMQIDEPYFQSLNESDVLQLPRQSFVDEDDLLECCKRNAINSDGKSYKGFPFFINLPLMLCRGENSEDLSQLPWGQFVDKIKEFDTNQKKDDPEELSFEFVKGTAENYNCLFFEILFSNDKTITKQKIEKQKFREFLETYGLNSAIIFWELCHKAHVKAKSSEYSAMNLNAAPGGIENIRFCKKAKYQRIWYSTLSSLSNEINFDQYYLSRLPGALETFGTWYMVIPRNCASPNFATKIVSTICSKNNAIERFEQGIGIPPYESLFLDKISSKKSILDFALNEMKESASSAFSRGIIPEYPTFARVFSFYLQRLLELSDDKAEPPKKEIKNYFTRLLSEITPHLKH